MNIIWHSASAIPFIALGNYEAALGCVAPDLTWIGNEIRFRKSKEEDWYAWAEKNINERNAFWYRCFHSLLFIPALCILFNRMDFLFGWAIHLLLDLPTHYGIMQQRPLYPFPYKWKYVFERYKK